jgi:hypothetical protein
MECADMSALWNDATCRAVALEALAEFLLKRDR